MAREKVQYKRLVMMLGSTVLIACGIFFYLLFSKVKSVICFWQGKMEIIKGVKRLPDILMILFNVREE